MPAGLLPSIPCFIKEIDMKKFKYIFLVLIFISSTAYSQLGGGGISGGGSGGVSVASDCDVAAYRVIGKLCQDSDDGKLYKGTGSSVLEVAAGASTGDVTGPSSSTDFEVAVFSGTGGKTLKRSNSFTGLAKLTEGVLSTVSLGTLTNGYICTYSTTSGIQCTTAPTTYLSTYPSAGIVKSTGSAWTTAATYSDVVGLWTACNDGYLKYDGTCATPAGGEGTDDVATDTIWDAKGDLAVGTGANTAAKLAIGTAYQILHVATDTPGWTSTLGATGTRLTKIWATDLEITNAPTINGAAWTTILQPLDGELTALAGLTSAANAIPYFTGSGTAGVISSSANMVSLLESEDYATARGNLGVAIGTNVQAYNADLDTISAGGTAGCLWGEKSDASGIECKTKLNLQLDDSAAQFKSAEASKGTLKFDQTGISDTKLVTVKYTATDSYTYTPTLVGNVSHLLGTTWTNGKWCSYSTSTGLTCNEDAPAGSGDVTGTGDCASGACYDGSSDGGTYVRLYDGTSAYESITGGVRTFTFSSSTANAEDLTLTLGNNDNSVTLSSSTGVTKASLSALNLVTTGTISGKIPMITKSSAYTLGTDDAQEAYGYIVWLTGDGTVLTLPAVAAGMSVCVYSADSYDKVVNPNDNDGIRNGTTTRNADGHAITSGATDQGSFVCLVGDSADGWTVLGKAGTWTDE